MLLRSQQPKPGNGIAYTVRVRPGHFTYCLRIAVFSTILIVAYFVSGFARAAQEDNNRDAAGIQLLATRFVAAIRHKSMDEMKTILHPGSRACIRAENRSYFDGILSRRLGYTIPSDYVLKNELRRPAFFSPPEAIAKYPVRPTRTLQIEYYTAPLSHTTILLSIAKKGSTWYEVLPCPTSDDMKRMVEMEAEKKAWDQRVQQLVSNLTDPLRSDIETLVSNGRRTDAVRKYQEASGEDLALAVAVIDTFAPGK